MIWSYSNIYTFERMLLLYKNSSLSSIQKQIDAGSFQKHRNTTTSNFVPLRQYLEIRKKVEISLPTMRMNEVLFCDIFIIIVDASFSLKWLHAALHWQDTLAWEGAWKRQIEKRSNRTDPGGLNPICFMQLNAMHTTL